MKWRKVVEFVRRERSTLLRLECGHDRSIGGHVFASGAKATCSDRYQCNDGTCWSATPTSAPSA